ncbi:translation initiation factor IF-2-like [Vidua chalybeata]|uniref:translation initiation factor IF-2-like n=1 Tax=Vidua chalybeata TaxID=81927 RepID=UPI0023A80361|nr:translation initiation factor IF-2-like [Vidua chalybeata]
MSRARGSPGNGGAGAAAATARPLTRRRKWRESARGRARARAAGARPGGATASSGGVGDDCGIRGNVFLERVGTERIEADTGCPERPLPLAEARSPRPGAPPAAPPAADKNPEAEAGQLPRPLRRSGDPGTGEPRRCGGGSGGRCEGLLGHLWSRSRLCRAAPPAQGPRGCGERSGEGAPLSPGPGGSRGGRAGAIRGEPDRIPAEGPRISTTDSARRRLPGGAAPGHEPGTGNRRARAGFSRDITAHPEPPRRRWMFAGAGRTEEPISRRIPAGSSITI